MILENILGSLARVRVLRALFLRDGVSGRNVAARAKISPSSGKAALDELTALGLVLKVPAGKRHVFEINRSHVFTEALAALFARENSYAEKVALRVGRTLSNEGGTELLAAGIETDGRVTLLLAPPLLADQALLRKLDRLLWFSFGLRLGALTTDPEAVRDLKYLWTARSGVMRAVDRGVKELIRFFDLPE